jgi:hypothetical protein
MSERPFTPLRIVGAVASSIAGELHGIAKSRALLPAEAGQLEAIDMLAAALLDARKTAAGTAAFGAAFGPFIPLFEAADIAARHGGLKVPLEAPAHPWPVTPAHFAWYFVLILQRALVVSASRGGASAQRQEQFEAATKLAAALAAHADNPKDAAALAEVEAVFLSAGGVLNGEEADEIVAEAYAAQLAAAPAGSA